MKRIYAIVAFILLSMLALAQHQTVRTLNQTNYASQFYWTRHPSSPTSIAAGAVTITLTSCPFGIATGSPYTVNISATGTPETVSVTGGTCTRGAVSGTIIFTAANSHSAGYMISSASFGLQEALNDAVTVGGSTVVIDSAWGGTTVGASIYGAATVAIQDIRGGFTLYAWNGSNYTATLPPPYVVVNGSPGTTLFKTVQLDTSGHATIGAASSATIIGVCVGGCGTTQSATVAFAGLTPILFTGTTTIGHFALVSSTPGEADDSAAEVPGRETLGTITSVNGGIGTTAIVNFTPHLAQGGVISSACANAFARYGTASNLISADCSTVLDGAGNGSLVSLTTTDASHAGAVNFLQGPAPASIPSNGVQISAKTGVTGYRFNLPTNVGTLNQVLCVGTVASNIEDIGYCSGASGFDLITSGTNIQALMGVGTSASLKPVNIGQVAGSQTWVQPGLVAPVIDSSNTGGGIGSAQLQAWQYTLNSALGETLPSILQTSVNGTAGCVSGTSCSFSFRAPTIPTGYTGYTAYWCDISGAGCTVPRKVLACVNILTACSLTDQTLNSGVALPTVNTAIIQPPNVQAYNGPAGAFPSIFFPKTDGNNYPWLSVDWNSCSASAGPPLPCGTPLFTHRTYFDDSQEAVQSGKNCFVCIHHQSGVGTVLTNQDRTLWLSQVNTLTDTSQHYSMAGLQDQVIVQGAPTWQAAVDAEVAAVSGQLNDNTTNVSGPGSVAVARFSYNRGNFGGQLGMSNSVAGVKVDFTNNSVTAFQGGSAWIGYQWAPTGLFGSNTNLTQIGLRALMPSAARSGTANVFIDAPNNGSWIPTNPVDLLIRNNIHNWNSLLNGNIGLDAITMTDPAALPINASVTVNGGLSIAQITSGWTFGASISCTGGVSTYNYKLVAVDVNGGQSVSAAGSGCTTGVNPLTVGNPVTIGGPALATLFSGPFNQAVRVDVYRTAGPMGLGKVGSFTCSNNMPLNGCSNFVDNGIAATTALPASNTSGGVVAYNFGTLTNCAAVGSAASPSVADCAAASAGSFSCATNAVNNCTVNTTAVTANSQIFISQREDATTGTRLGVTCNVTPSVVNANAITAVVTGTSFTFALTQPVTNPDCFSYLIVN